MRHAKPGRAWNDLPRSDAGRLVHWFEWVWNRRNADVIDLLFAQDGLAHGLGDTPMRGPKEFRAFHQTFLAVFSPLQFQLEHAFDVADHVVVHAHIHVHDQGTPLKVSGIALCRMENGQIAEAWNHFDFVPVLINRGLVSMDDVLGVFDASR